MGSKQICGCDSPFTGCWSSKYYN